MDRVRSIPHLLEIVHSQKPNPTAFNFYQEEQWHSISTENFLKEVELLALGLSSLGVKKGDTIGLYANSSYPWILADFAIMSIGAVTVPLFENLSPHHLTFELEQTSPKFIFVQNYHPLLAKVTPLITIEPQHAIFENSYPLDKVLLLGKELQKSKPNYYQELKSAIQEDDLATIIYTSGSSGVPKGVMHSHKSILATIHDDKFGFAKDEHRFLSFLPLPHVFARHANLRFILWGVSIYYCTELQKLGQYFRDVHPTTIITVPRMLEKLYIQMLMKIEEAHFLKHYLGLWAFHLAQDEDHPLYTKVFHPLADQLLYSKLRENLGGCLNLVVSGGAHLNPHLSHFFSEIGVPIYEGWGLTETAGPVTGNCPDRSKPGTIGSPLDNFEIAISSNDEIIVKGNGLMQGYFKNDLENAAVMDASGWFHTGDKGKIDSEGFLTIIGRLKEIYKTSYGKYISPVCIEQFLCMSSLIDKALIIAENRPCVTCLLIPEFEVVKKLKIHYQSEHLSHEEFLASEFFINQVEALIESVNAKLDHWEQIHAYRILSQPLSVETEELTSTLKIKRNVVERKYQHLIESMYVECEQRKKKSA